VLSQLQLLSSLEEVESIRVLSLSAAPVSADLLRELESVVPKVRAETPILRDVSVRRSAQALMRFTQRRLLRNEPYLLAVHDVPQMRALIEECLYANRFELVYIGYLGMMAYSRLIRRVAPTAAILLEEHNIEWRIFDRLAKDATQPKRQIIGIEARALRRAEQKALCEVDAVVAISESDAQHFAQLANCTATVVPPFVEPGSGRAEHTTEERLGYIGHLGWQPNVYGLNWFCSDVWPLVRARIPQAQLTIAGPGLPRDATGGLVVPAAWTHTGIEVVGFVDELETLYRKSLAMIAPVIGGSGVRMKLLETLGAGMPTVTTSDGAAGLHLVHEKNVLIADTAQGFSDCVARLVTDAPLRQRLREGGFEYLRHNHSKAVAAGKLKDAIRLAVEVSERHASVLSEE
jgi:glycosyltransferase involved in cell wall biosynthesis